MRIVYPPHKPIYDLICLGFLLALIFGFSLGDRPYSAPSESRYIEIGREMAESGDFITPRLNYVKYFEKPPLFYWIQAASTKVFGTAPFAARIPTAGFAVLLCLLTYSLGRILYGRFAGWLSAVILASSLYTFVLSRIVLLDMPESFFMAATLVCFLYAIDTTSRRSRTFAIYAMYIAAAGAVLTKGLIGAVLPGAVIFIWLLCTGLWGMLKQLRLFSGTVLFLLITVPWHVLVSLNNPEFPHFYFIHEHFQRYLTKEAGRYQPVWFFVAVLLGGLFPWTVFLYQAKKDALRNFWTKRHEDSRPLFLGIWLAFIFVFFSLSDSKLIPYILPIFPPLAAIIGNFLAKAWAEKKTPGFTAGFWGMILFFIAMAAAPLVLTNSLDADNKIRAALAQGGEDVQFLSVACMIAAGLLMVTHIQGRNRHVILAMLLAAVAITQLGDQVGAHYNKDSMKTFAGIIQSVHRPGDEVAMYQVYYQDMPVYIKERVTIADWKGELEFGSEHEDDSAWMMSAPAFWERWLKDDHRMFVVMREDALDRLTKDKTPAQLHLFTIQKEGRNTLYLNRDPFAKPAQPQSITP